MTVIDMTVIEYSWDKPPARLNLTTLLRIGSSPVATERWSVHEPAVAPGYVAAIVVAGGSDACIYSPSPDAGGCSWSRSHAPH